MSDTHLARASDAASYAERLEADIGRAIGTLNKYRGSPDVEILRDRAHAARLRLEAICIRLNALGKSADPGRYPLSEAEHIALDAARALRRELIEAVARYQSS
jgi:hypothetical protein